MVTARTYNELFERPYHLQLERESAEFWIVVDAHQPDAPMIRTPSWDTAARFIETFLERTPGATSEALHSWRVAQRALSEREVIATSRPEASELAGPAYGAAAPAVKGEPASRSENVYPLFHDHLDESA